MTADPGAGPSRRFRLLEPVGQYARDRLVEEGEAKSAYAAHLDHYLGLAEQAAPHYQDGEQVEWLARIDAEHANLTAAAERGLASGENTLVARLSWALWMYWWLRGHHAHGRRLAEAALAHDLPDDVRPRAELAAATMCFAMDDIPASRHWWQQAQEHALEGSDLIAQANSIAGRRSGRPRRGRPDRGARVLRPGGAARRAGRPAGGVDRGPDPRVDGDRGAAVR